MGLDQGPVRLEEVTARIAIALLVLPIFEVWMERWGVLGEGNRDGAYHWKRKVQGTGT